MVQLQPRVIKNVLSNLKETSYPRFGQMSPQQMVEHLEEMFDISMGKIEVEVFTPEEKLGKWKHFLMSDLPFKPFKSPRNEGGLPPLVHGDLDIAKKALQDKVKEFHAYYKDHPAAQALSPAFGPLSYYEWKKFHGKHLQHHFRQFKLIQ
ncbi:MAG: DUF1569 domain-containing protein [Saprospiraceae bacterium]|nr:DUF1569 domain-containing protein [Saprospiraceae bacterium]